MKRIIPIILITLAGLLTLLSLSALILCAAAMSVPLLLVSGLSLTIVCTVGAALLAGLGFVFFRDKLCRIAFALSLVSAAMVVVSYILIALA